jgi:hypothetical protein
MRHITELSLKGSARFERARVAREQRSRMMPFEATTMDGVERFFVALTIAGFAGLTATLTWPWLIWLGAIAAGY